ncbi:DUF2512 family protein [Alteribacillus iranensis]|uniref:4 TMS phage holin, superfamily IV n=1 Tax=Alteribacillus iranensis TaxID=930128 RepID=A0A1I2E0E6_9BACI|nr:DUF2512 family protein [Alteribacillus iranensis]SFE86147.1 Protein of unknown function [Alteribacillus iranensis]
MAHLKALAIKGIMTLAVLWLILSVGFDLLSFGTVFLITVVLGAVSYFAGDLSILPKKRNMIATASDFVLTFLIIFLMGMIWTGNVGTLATASFIAALIIAVGEYFFHYYVASNVLPKRKRVAASNN